VKFVTLVWAGLWRKRSRSILILLQVIIAFALFGVLQGLTSGINHAIAATHADRLYVASKLDFGDPLPVSILERLKTVSGIVGVAPRYQFGASYQRPEQGLPICATDVDAFFAMYPEDKVDPAQQRAMRQIQDGVIVGMGTMRKYGWKIGQRVTLQSPPQFKRTDGTNNWTFDIVGTWVDSEEASDDNDQLLITNYRYVNESLPIGPARDTMNFAVLRIADPARATSIEQTIDSQYANSSNETLTQSEHELVQSEVSNFGDIDTVAHRIVGAAFFVLLFATGALMMQSIRERTPELAVLKTVGFSDTRVMTLILIETLVLCLAGATVGLLLGTRLLPVAREQIGTVTVPPIVFVVGIACAVVLALAGGSTAAWRGLRLRVADALANR
jgi:putative ABC transport system permease protein